MIFHCQMKICPCSSTFFVELCFIIPRGLLSLFLFTAGSILFFTRVLLYFHSESLRNAHRDVFDFASGGGVSVVIGTVLDQTSTAKGSY